MIGWAQAISFSLLGIAIVTAITALMAHYMSLKHQQKLKRMEQDREIVREHLDEDGGDDE